MGYRTCLGNDKNKGNKMKNLIIIFILLFIFAYCKSPEANILVNFTMISGPKYNFYLDFFTCEGTIKNGGNFDARLCRIYITIKDLNSKVLITNWNLLDPTDIPALGRGNFSVFFNDTNKNISNKMDKTKMIWEVKYEK